MIAFLAVPITTRLIIPAEFGRASLFMTSISLLSMFITFGIQHAFIRDFYVVKDKNKLLVTSLLIPLIFSLVIILVGILFYQAFSIYLFGKTSFIAILFLVIAIPLSLILSFNLLLLRMEDKAVLYSVLLIIQQSIRVIFLVSFILYFKSYLGIIFAEFGTIFLVSLILLFINRDNRFSTQEFDFTLFKQLLRFGLPLVPASLIYLLFESYGKYSLRLWSNFTELGIFSIAFTINAVLNLLGTAFQTFWMPTGYRWYENNEDPEKFTKVGNMISVIMTTLGMSMILFRDVIGLILGAKYLPALKIIPFLVFIPLLFTLRYITFLGIFFKRRTELTNYADGFGLILAVVLGYVLIPKYGAMGAAISMCLSSITSFVIGTLISKALWHPLKIRNYFINIIILLCASFITLLLHNNFYLSITLVGLTIVLWLINWDSIRSGYPLVKSIIRKTTDMRN
jgi:O-antigen/teichoic acid export membrane protein